MRRGAQAVQQFFDWRAPLAMCAARPLLHETRCQTTLYPVVSPNTAAARQVAGPQARARFAQRIPHGHRTHACRAIFLAMSRRRHLASAVVIPVSGGSFEASWQSPSPTITAATVRGRFDPTPHIWFWRAWRPSPAARTSSRRDKAPKTLVVIAVSLTSSVVKHKQHRRAIARSSCTEQQHAFSVMIRFER